VSAPGGRDRAIGRSVLRLEDRPLLTGAGCFVDDLHLPGTVDAAILRSAHGHAAITAVDTAAAHAHPGVLDVITAADIPEALRIPMRTHARPGMERFLQPPLARDRVRYSGEPVAVVVADSRYRAEDAAALIEVTYEPLPPVLAPEGAADGGPALLFDDAATNVAAEVEVAYGDVDEAFERAEVIVEERIACQRHTAVPLEPRGLVAELDERTDVLTLWGAAKLVHANRRVLAGLLGRPEERVRLVELAVGGGFGARGEFHPEDYLIPLAALRVGRPVKWIADREEDLRSTNHSREQVHRVALALDADGAFLGLRDDAVFDTGAYVRTNGSLIAGLTAGLLPGPYRFGAYRARVRQVVSNKTPAGPYRAPGRFEMNVVRERIVDVAARRLGIAPEELRRRNLVDAASMPYRTGTHTSGHPVVYDSGDYAAQLGTALELFDHDEMLAWRSEPAPPGKRRGVGIACFVEESAIAQWDYGRVAIDSEGRAVVHVGAASVGQGLDTAMAQICADALGIAYEDVAAVRHGDTDSVPAGIGSFGSRATAMAGAAVLRAAEAVRARVLEHAADLLEAAPGDLEIVDGRVLPRGSPTRGVSLAEVAAAARPEQALSRKADPGLTEESYFFCGDTSFPYGVQCAAVEVDVETGAVEIVRHAIAYDVGRKVNPMLLDGQIVGGAVQGIGGALLEELAYGPEGQLVASSFMDYLLPTAREAPAMSVLVTEDAPSPHSPFGAKGAGEGGIAGAGAVVANAVSDALGAEALELPLTPERLVRIARSGLSRPARAPA
jgi:aerobic carbon-monoxide dehydrogenase large subunit